MHFLHIIFACSLIQNLHLPLVVKTGKWSVLSNLTSLVGWETTGFCIFLDASMIWGSSFLSKTFVQKESKLFSVLLGTSFSSHSCLNNSHALLTYISETWDKMCLYHLWLRKSARYNTMSMSATSTRSPCDCYMFNNLWTANINFLLLFFCVTFGWFNWIWIYIWTGQKYRFVIQTFHNYYLCSSSDTAWQQLPCSFCFRILSSDSSQPLIDFHV